MSVDPSSLPLQVSASGFYGLHSPSNCTRRVYLASADAAKAPPSPYDEVLRELGARHEAAHLEGLGPYEDLSAIARGDRVERTLAAIVAHAPVVYQPRFEIETELAGVRCSVVGEPDFLIARDEGYVIRDAKMARRITEGDHPEVLRQVETYGWLFQESVGSPPVALEVFNGRGEIVAVPMATADDVRAKLAELVELMTADAEPYSPVGWTKCGPCPFHGHCWPRAERAHDLALIPGVDQGLAGALHGQGVETREQLLERFDVESLAGYQRPWGTKTQRVGKRAEAIIRSAEALRDNREVHLQTPELPDVGNFVVFDLEGLPPHLDELDKVFLWGLQVCGEDPGPYTGVVAGFGEDGDQRGWREFLEAAKAVFEKHGDIPWVHWATYEKTKLSAYIERFGDPDGVGGRVLANLLDLLPVTQRSVVLPLPSYSLKVVEGYVGFERSQDEYGGTWAMAMFVRATECEQKEERDKLIEQIRQYNEEDLESTWAVLEWLRGLGGADGR